MSTYISNRKKYAQQRQWVIQKFIECCGDDAVIIGTAIYDQLALIENAKNPNPSSATEPALDHNYAAEIKKEMIAEGKKTRKMFDHAGKWVKESIEKANNILSKNQISSARSKSSSKLKFSSHGFKVRGSSFSKMSTHSKSSGRLTGRSEITTARSVLRELMYDVSADKVDSIHENTAVIDRTEVSKMESPSKHDSPTVNNIPLDDSSISKQSATKSDHSSVVSLNRRKSRVSFSLVLDYNSPQRLLNTEDNTIAENLDLGDQSVVTRSRSDSFNNRSFLSALRISSHHELNVLREQDTTDTEVVVTENSLVEVKEKNEFVVDSEKLKLNLNAFIDREVDSDDDEDDDEEEAIPTVIKNDMFAYLDKSLATIKQTEKQQRNEVCFEIG